MKKTNLILFFLLTGTIFFLSITGVWAQTSSDAAPAFDQQPSVVFDLWKNGGKGKYNDYVKFINATLNENISFNIYGYDQKNGKWTLIGASQLKYHSDFDTVDSPWGGKMNKFRWLAIYSLDNKEFDAQVMTNRNDIYVTIINSIPTENKPQTNNDTPIFESQSSVVLDLWENRNKGKYNDYVKLINASSHRNISLNVYGYDQKDNQWIIIGPARFKKIGDTDTVDSPWTGNMKKFRWIAVQSLEGIAFNAQATANSNDITIMIDNK